MPTTLATRKPVNAQPKAAKPCTSRAAVGSAADTAIASNAISVITVSRPSVVGRSAGAKIDRGVAAVRASVCSSTVTSYTLQPEPRFTSTRGADPPAGVACPVAQYRASGAIFPRVARNLVVWRDILRHPTRFRATWLGTAPPGTQDLPHNNWHT